jgi:hypothetical protein
MPLLTGEQIQIPFILTSGSQLLFEVDNDGVTIPSINSGSKFYGEAPAYLLTQSFNNFSASYVLDSASFDFRISSVDVSDYVQVVNYNAYTQSNDVRVTNTYASQSNYTPSSSFQAYTQSVDTFISSTNNFIAGNNTFTSSIQDQVNNVYTSQSNYTPSSSYLIDSSSFDGRILSNSASIYSIIHNSGSLATLTDVALATPSNGQALIYDNVSAKWKNSSYISASVSGTASNSPLWNGWANNLTTLQEYNMVSLSDGILGFAEDLVTYRFNAQQVSAYLQLGTAAFMASESFATDAQGIKADTAYGWGNHALAGYFLASNFDSSGDARWVQLSGSYTNPSWIVSIPWSKITSTPTTLAGYGITDAQAALLGTGIVKSVAGTISYVTDNSTNWNTAYDRSLTSIGFSGGTLTLTKQDATTLSASLDGRYVLKSGDTMAGSLLIPAPSALDSTLTVGTDVLNIGTSNADTINIGWSGATVNIQGTTLYENVTNLAVADKLFTVNKGGAAASGVSAGFEIEEGGSITGYFATDATRTGWDFKSPASQQLTLGLDLLTASRIIKMPDASGTIALLTSFSTTATGLTYTNTTGVLSLTAGYVIPTTTNETNWNTAYSQTRQWDGGATGLVAATGRTSLGLVIGTDVQAYSANLASLSGLTYSSTSFVKMTGAGTFSLDTNTYTRRITTPFTAQTTVTVTHNFGVYPVVQVIDNTGAVFVPMGIVNNTLNDFTVTFSASTTGNIITIG